MSICAKRTLPIVMRFINNNPFMINFAKIYQTLLRNQNKNGSSPL